MQYQEARKVLTHFKIPERKYNLTRGLHGLINNSFIVEDPSTGKKTYFLQQIDNTIFKDIEGLMNNIEVVTHHFNSLELPPNHLNTLSAKNGFNYFKTDLGAYWRLYDYIDGETYYKAESRHISSEAGRALGEFQNSLTGIDMGKLKTTIPGFHDIDIRYSQFKASLTHAKQNRKENSADLITVINKNIDFVKKTYHDIVEYCPSRVTHNDTKLSNLLFTINKEALCVVDYDTIMPGFLPLDFGDSVRTICSTTLEDDIDLANTNFNLELYGAFTTSFIKALSENISNEELELLPRAVAYMPFIMGLRMLTDYLNNDIYFSTNYDNHNFDRAANQLTLFTSGVEQLDELNNIVILNNPNSQKVL